MTPPTQIAWGRGDAARAERGSALVFVLLAFVVLSVAAASFMTLTNIETKIAGHDVRRSAALNTAEAGVAEAVARLRSGDIPDNGNPRLVAQIFNAEPGFVPVLGADSIALATLQPAGEWLPYSMATRGPRVLSVRYKTNAARTLIYRYDPAKTPSVQTSTGMPIFIVTSTGRKGRDYRRVESEFCLKPVTVLSRAALMCEQGIDFSGDSFMCGYNHRTDVPAWTEGGPCATYHVGSLDKTGAWSASTISTDGSSVQQGDPTPKMENQTGFYAGPWEMLSMTHDAFYAWLGNPVPTVVDPPRGVLYFDNNGTYQDRSGAWEYHGGNGEGFMYVDGDLTVNGNFTYRGLIYIEGDLMINGNSWILGGLVVKGTTRVKIASGDCAILYSDETIRQKIARYGGELVTLSWMEDNR